MGAAAHAGVEVDGYGPVHLLDHPRQGVDGGDTPVVLRAAVVGHHDCRRTDAYGSHRVVRVQNALDDHRQRGAADQVLQVSPAAPGVGEHMVDELLGRRLRLPSAPQVEQFLEVRLADQCGRRLFRHRVVEAPEGVVRVPVPLGHHRKVHRADDRVEARGRRLTDQFLVQPAVLRDVHLAPTHLARRRAGHLFRRATAEQRKAESHPEFRGGPRRRDLGILVVKALHPHGSHQKRSRQRTAHDLDRGVDVGHVAHHPGNETEGIQLLHVAKNSGFVPRSPGRVMEYLSGKSLPRRDRQRVNCAAGYGVCRHVTS